MKDATTLKIGIFKLLQCFLILLSLLAPKICWAEHVQVAVLYPESRGNFSKVFENMLSGIKEQANITIVSRKISPNSSAEETNNWLLENNAQTILALGQRSYKLIKKLSTKLPITIGALVVSPNGHNGISLAGDPEMFFQHLKNLAPEVKRVFIVYSEKNTGWLIDLAEKSAQKHNIKLVAHKADDIKQGVKYYDEILSQAKSGKDAIWIPLDRIVPDKTILPKILQTAWKRNIVVFSNNPLHTKKGTLFALFPDHKQMGTNLAQLAVNQFHSKAKPLVIPAMNLKLAVNRRTASHLGLHFSKSKQRKFDVVFPSR
jgi:putative tryptophan/tyrosine transport system substrate-binding protein